MRPLPSLVLACLLALAAPSAVAVSNDEVGWDDRVGRDRAERGGEPDGTVQGTDKPQTSDGVVGPAAAAVPPMLRDYRQTSGLTTWRVAPGVNVTRWDERDARGPVRLHLLAVRWRTPGLTVDYANAGPVRKTAPVSAMLARDQAIAGVNGDFFDIGRTGAPLGIGRDRNRGLLHGRLSGWNEAFSIARGGRPDIGPLAVRTNIKQRPGTLVTNLNSPQVTPNGVGVYTKAWGDTPGYRVSGGRHGARLVQVVGGKVVRNVKRWRSGKPFEGRLLIGRGDGAAKLSLLRKGRPVTMGSYLQGQPQMAITGNKILLSDGLIDVVDDRELHPRTAVGIDRDTSTLLFLTVDGRQSFSRGYTMVELAEKMIELGADEALNLDGGGSTTLVARRPGAGVGVVNSPSDGAQRSVANAVEIRFRKPLKRR